MLRKAWMVVLVLLAAVIAMPFGCVDIKTDKNKKDRVSATERTDESNNAAENEISR